MAQSAVLRESGGLVRGVIGSVVVGEVATDTGRATQVVVAVDVARGALLGGMESHQEESRGGVVERAAVPVGRGVAASAVLREAGCRVVGARGFLEIGEMASHALLRSTREDSVHVTLGAGYADVRSGQWESAQTVIERGVLPTRVNLCARCFAISRANSFA